MYEVYEKKYYAKEADTIEIDMDKGDTLMFSLNDIISSELQNTSCAEWLTSN